MEEIWKPVPGWEGIYRVSNKGNVQRLVNSHGNILEIPKTLKPHPTHGYEYICLSRCGRIKAIKISSLVLLAFVGPRPEKLEVSHLDGNRTNDVLSNLVYETRYENIQRKRQHGTLEIGENNPQHKLNNKQVIQIRNLRKRGYSNKYLAEKFGLVEEHVSRICNGRFWKHLLAAEAEEGK